MTDQPAHSAEGRHGRENSGENSGHDNRENIDPPSWFDDHTEAISQQSLDETAVPETAEPPSNYAEFHTPGYGTPAVSDGPPRPLSGFRSEQRFSEPTGLPSAPPPRWNPPPPPEWTSQTPPTGIREQFPPRPEYFSPPSAPPPPDYHDEPAPPPPAQYRPEVPQTPYPDLSTTSLLRQVKPAPSSGWRRALYVMSGKLINVGESPRDVHRNNLIAHVNQPLAGCYRIAVVSLKGGVGKTTITATLGSTFAAVRGDRVIAVDANPDRGTLSQKVPLQTAATVRDLLRDAGRIDRYSDIRTYTSQGPSRLEVLASETDPAVSEAFSADDYARTLDVLEKFYSLVLTDCGTGLMHSAMAAVLARADTLVVVSSGSVDGARSASATLDWLEAHGHQDLVRNSVAVINAVRPRPGKIDIQKVVDHFSRRCRAVRLVPFDPHLEEGAEINLDLLRRDTREALLDLAAVVADGFPANRGGDSAVR
ncbi:MinD/ParA family ATP-binding protein [Mycolicibacterium mengxianglii]|uniref:MinD/ParA family ATP-binding protein n=1 Tax=Mycolicibacterium mengxianglii TaxID=2736649 RepID=UPI0018EF257D|nr:MinD/ParA family protein [Mycolicibacterium mengxianglii]